MNKTAISSLPQDILPEYWFQDERMNAMFAEFRSHSVNPQDWNAKYQFWKELIFKWLSHNKKCQFFTSELTVAFQRNGITPRCLTTVIEKLLQSNQIITEDQFHHQIYHLNSSWTSWSFNFFIKSPYLWSLTKVQHFFNLNNHAIHNNPNQVHYIHLKVIHELANDILDFIKDNDDSIILPFGQILNKCITEKNIHEADAKFALMWINHIKNNHSIIDFNHLSSDSLLKISTSKGVENLTEYEQGLFQLMQCEKSILKDIQNLEMEKNTIIMEIKSFIRQNNTCNVFNVTIKTLLRKKKQIEKRIDKQTAIFKNIQVLITNIHDAKSNSEMFETFKKSTELLKNFKLCPLDVHDTMDDLHEAVDELSETQNALTSELYQKDESISLEELEEEFNNLFVEQSNKSVDTEINHQVKSSDHTDLHFPQVPTTTCTPQKQEKVQLST